MRHRTSHHSFGRRPNHRKALIRGLVTSLVEHERIKTTLPKAKELRRHVERAVTMGKKDSVHARRILLSRFPNKETVHKVFSDLAPRFAKRPGGYTRIVKLGTRPGDAAEMAYIEFVDFDPTSKIQAANDSAEAKSGDKVKAEKKTKSVKKPNPVSAKKKQKKFVAQARKSTRKKI